MKHKGHQPALNIAFSKCLWVFTNICNRMFHILSTPTKYLQTAVSLQTLVIDNNEFLLISENTNNCLQTFSYAGSSRHKTSIRVYKHLLTFTNVFKHFASWWICVLRFTPNGSCKPVGKLPLNVIAIYL